MEKNWARICYLALIREGLSARHARTSRAYLNRARQDYPSDSDLFGRRTPEPRAPWYRAPHRGDTALANKVGYLPTQLLSGRSGRAFARPRRHEPATMGLR
jgi:hypothetical protein